MKTGRVAAALLKACLHGGVPALAGLVGRGKYRANA
jgi:hypothetical protein